MKNRVTLLVLAIFFFFSTLGSLEGSARSYTPDQLVGKSEAYARQLSTLINYEKSKTVKAVSTTLMTSTKTSITNATTSVKKMKKSTTRQKLESRIMNVQLIYSRAVSYNNSLGIGERLKSKTQTLLSAYAKNPSSDATNTAYRSLNDDAGKFSRSIGLVFGKSTRDAITKKYKLQADIALKQTLTAAALKGEMSLLSMAFKSGKNETIFGQVDHFNAQLGKARSNPVLYNAFASSYEDLLKEKGLSSNGVPTIILKKIIANENSVVYLEVDDKNGKPMSQGSGFIVGKSTILTNFHVIQDGYRVVAYNNDGKVIAINGVVKYDPDTDLALLGTAADLTLPSLKIGNIDYLEKGDPIVTIGSPEGLVNTVSTGIISNLHKMDDNGKTVNMIQITAPITHGSSGGALFNEYGEIIGVTSSGFESGNLNFAVGINHAETWIQAYGNMSASKLPFIPYESLPQSNGNGTVTDPPATPAEPAPKGPFPISTDKLVLGANLKDVVMNPDKPIIYGISDGKDIIEINLETKQTRKITLNLAPERIFFANNELYVTLPKGQHGEFWMPDTQVGAFAVINAETMTLVDQVDMTMDPFDVVADSESIYLSGASGQWTDLKVFSRKTLLETADVPRVCQGLLMEIDPEGKQVYALDTAISPRYMESFQFKDGKRAGHFQSQEYGQYPLDGDMNLSPDGKYLFNGSGPVYNASGLNYLAKLPQTYEEIAFDVKNNRFYTSSKKGLEVYDYSTFAKLKHYDLQHGIDQMFVQDKALIVVYKDPTGTLPKQAIKKYPLNAEGVLTMPPTDAPSADPSLEPEQFVPVSAAALSLPKIPVTTDKTILPVDMKKEILNPEKPVLYGLSTSGKDLVEYNLSTKQTRKVTFDYPPDKLFFANNELYVSLKKQTNFDYGQPSVGAFAVVDADTFTLKKQVDISLDPADIVADAGYIYISDGGASTWTKLKAYSRMTYEETGSFGMVLRGSTLVIHPDGGKVYATDSGTSPRDIQMYQFTDGKNTTTYDSPYHGDYPFTVNMKVSPDGKYIFNGSGVVLQMSSIRSEDMKYVTKLYNPFEEIAFDVNHNRVYTSSKKGLDIYDYSTFERIKHYELPYDIDYMSVQDNNLIVTYREAATGILPKKTIEKYPLTEDGVLTMQEQ